ncbi:MAG: phosphatidylserine/phosphatidylglycerophosphate/cardiolipin synthase family protein [Chlamydiota bacterium]
MLPGKKYSFREQIASTVKVGALLFLLFIFFYFSYQVTHPLLPSKKHPILFYSNQTGDDLKRIVLNAIEGAKKSIFLQIYGCTDPAVISSLLRASEKGTSVRIFYDPSGSSALYKKIPQATPLIRSGLMHKKILVLDDKTVFIGTANFTPTSLCMHDNVILGLRSKELAYDLQHSLKNRLHYTIGGQEIDLWHLPDFQQECLNNTLHLLSKAEKTIHIALFTFTHPKILEALFAAKERGVKICVALDYYTAKGASLKTVELLQKAHIPLYISKGGKLLHHKWCLIDKSTLLLGSANWTKSAFTINEDCLLVIHALTDFQKKYFDKIWKSIESNSIEQKIS